MFDRVLNTPLINHGTNICDALSDSVPFVQFEKREKHPWRSVTFSKVADFPKWSDALNYQTS